MNGWWVTLLGAAFTNLLSALAGYALGMQHEKERRRGEWLAPWNGSDNESEGFGPTTGEGE